MKVLLVEDDPQVARFIMRGLSEERFVVDVATNGEDGLHQATTGSYDVIILDVLLPKRDGFEVLAQLRRAGRSTRVLMLTARDAVADRVRGLEGGADDYLVKPFAFAELLARLRALLRRPVSEEPEVLECSGLRLDVRRQTVARDGCPVSLTAREFAVLAHLVRHAGEVITRTRLAEQVWDENFDPLSNVIDVTIYHLREKVDREFPVRLIHTVRGSGYVLREAPVPEDR
ncbi:MAG: heavy metal response regulator transcription factor [Verrucomicrobia bacterium]|nr:heavy metal response regulator transcription factor [Verrucomicrobiota bacterium]